MKDQSFHLELLKTLKEDLANLALKGTFFPLTKVLKFIVSNSLLLGLNGATVVAFGAYLEGVTFVPSLFLAAFMVTFAVYGLNKFTDRTEDLINRPETSLKSSSYYLVFSILSMLVGFLIGLLNGIFVFSVLCAPVLIGVIYSVKISKSIPRLKEIVGVKSIVVAVSWALTGSFLPGSFNTGKLQVIFFVFVYIFIRVFVGATLCDVLDKKGDLASGVETIPIRLGRTKTKKLLIFLNSFGIFLPIYCYASGMVIHFVPALLFGVFYGYLAIWFFFKNNCNRFIAGLLLDGEWIPIVIIIYFLIR